MAASRYAPDTTSGTGGAWYRAAACAGMDTALWFPARHAATTEEAKRWCQTCPVREACLDAALDEERGGDRKQVHGIRGGLTSDERVRIHKQTEQAAA